jgi:hypothetical protein
VAPSAPPFSTRAVTAEPDVMLPERALPTLQHCTLIMPARLSVAGVLSAPGPSVIQLRAPFGSPREATSFSQGRHFSSCAHFTVPSSSGSPSAGSVRLEERRHSSWHGASELLAD